MVSTYQKLAYEWPINKWFLHHNGAIIDEGKSYDMEIGKFRGNIKCFSVITHACNGQIVWGDYSRRMLKEGCGETHWMPRRRGIKDRGSGDKVTSKWGRSEDGKPRDEDALLLVQRTSRYNEVIPLCCFVVAIYVTYISQGLLQEHM